MKVEGKDYRTVWMEGDTVCLIEQNLLPFEFKIFRAENYKQTCMVISTMIVRGAGAIGATAGYAMAQAFLESGNDTAYVEKARQDIENTRPTAQNLFYAVERVYRAGQISTEQAVIEAQKIADEDAEACKKIGELGNDLIEDGFNIETHCNAGWLAFVDYGSALSPVYVAHRANKKVFVYADETRPRGQGARLTAWELKNEDVPHVIIPDNAGAHLMSLGKIDMMIVGSDRIAANGDVANKIGTLEKAIAAKYYGIPFYVAAPTSTIDFNCASGKDIPIEQRHEDEVLYQSGPNAESKLERVLIGSPGSEAFNPAFDVTPAELVTAIITERGIFKPAELAAIRN
ncbi:MAG: S-methyl-5-thioribose-1-phosphate isomerase [Gammaproteobacteria bacterium]|nr:S-methyl-5-thioribose-1-phosphate isomerase [Gammaproteobacteria bacterium]MCW8923479.1 S-methyl-5-thioribose-1-phosphate isomerase [Gammaproteobacteria bacterium]